MLLFTFPATPFSRLPNGSGGKGVLPVGDFTIFGKLMVFGKGALYKLPKLIKKKWKVARKKQEKNYFESVEEELCITVPQ